MSHRIANWARGPSSDGGQGRSEQLLRIGRGIEHGAGHGGSLGWQGIGAVGQGRTVPIRTAGHQASPAFRGLEVQPEQRHGARRRPRISGAQPLGPQPGIGDMSREGGRGDHHGVRRQGCANGLGKGLVPHLAQVGQQRADVLMGSVGAGSFEKPGTGSVEVDVRRPDRVGELVGHRGLAGAGRSSDHHEHGRHLARFAFRAHRRSGLEVVVGSSPLVESVHGEPSVGISGPNVQAWITLRGGHLAPVTFRSGGRSLQPYSLSPWLPGDHPGVDPILDVLRGDFWCLPFGPQPDGVPHGSAASEAWEIQEWSPQRVTMAQQPMDVGGRLRRTVWINETDSAVYQEFRVDGVQGRFPVGSHPVLDMSGGGQAHVTTSPMRWCSVAPGLFSDPARGEHQVLQPGATFTSLNAVPCSDGSTLDLANYPTPSGHEDLVMLVNDPAAGPVGWSAVSFLQANAVWFQVKSVERLPATLLWVSNGGRSQPPWSSRHLGRMGIEDVCSYFAAGLVESRQDLLAELGIPTTVAFHADQSWVARTAHAVAFPDEPLGAITDIRMSESGSVTLVGSSGRTCPVALDWQMVLAD